MPKTTNTLMQLTNELENLRNKRANELRRRIDELVALRKRIDTELAVLVDEIEHVEVPSIHRRRSRLQTPDCGTESGYQRHRHRGESCDDCKAAHAEHERLKSARRRLARMAGGAA